MIFFVYICPIYLTRRIRGNNETPNIYHFKQYIKKRYKKAKACKNRQLYYVNLQITRIFGKTI
jgi:hypothetical protein